MHYSPESLQAFAEAACLGSFSAAARKLGKSQSTISEAIARLEIDLGLTLFDRSSRQPQLTEAGHALLGRVEEVLMASDREVSLKKLAAAAGAKDAAMLPAAEAERITGYHVGGISPLGQKKRVRVFIERASLAASILPNPAAVENSLYAHLEKQGNRPIRAIQRIRAANLGEEDANLLQVPAGSAGLNIERTSYLASGRVIEFTRSIYRGDAYDFVAELRLGEQPQNGLIR